MTDPGVVELDRLTPEVRDALRREILFLADSKRVLGIRYSDWLLGAPSIESAIAASSMAQDEWGHARLIYAMLKDFDLDPVEVEHQRSAAEYCCVACLDRPFESWADYVAAVVVVDGALALLMDGLARGGYEAAAGRIPKMLSEEAFHRDMGVAWYRRISGGTDEGRGALRDATNAVLAPALACLDPDDEPSRLLADQGLMPPGGELRAAFLERNGSLLERLGVDASSVEPDRSGWDAVRRRSPGEPDAETVERARGDRNRALFVE